MAQFIPITDFAAPELDVYARIPEAQLLHYHEPKPGLFIAESPKVIARALDAGYVPVSALAEEPQLDGEARDVLARLNDIPIYTAETPVLRQLTGFPMTRGMLCAMKRQTLPTPASVCGQACRVAVLDHVVNPTNVGAIFRSAAALHMDAVLLTPGCSDPLYRRAIRVSMGTVFQIPWTFLEGERNGENPAAELRRLGFSTAALALREDSISIDDPALLREERLAVFLGSEGDGLAPETIAACDYTVLIPMSHGVDSLNVAAASAVAFWELRKRQE